MQQLGICDLMSKGLIYHVCKRENWLQSEVSGVYRGGTDDVVDGFLHFSTANQIAESISLYWYGTTDLILICVDADDLGTSLKWERSRDNQFFPHLYDVLDMSVILSVQELTLNEDGSHRLPDNLSSFEINRKP